MPQYQYTAINALGKKVSGKLIADNTDDLDAQLIKMDMNLLKAQKSRARSGFSLNRSKVSRKDLITLCFHLEQLLNAGVPLLECLQDLTDAKDNPALAEMVSGLITAIEGGKSLSEAMTQYPEVFDSIFISLIKVGEKSGQLSQIFFNLAETIKWQDELAAKMKKVMTSPIFMGVVLLGVIVMLMVFLVPQLIAFITGMGGQLPMHTQALIATSDFFVNYWFIVIAIPPSLVILLKLYVASSERGRYQFDLFKLTVPPVGPILKKIILARFSNYFALMYAGGLPLLDCLKSCEGLVGNKVLELALVDIHQKISIGKGIAESFRETGHFPSLVERMIQIGENTGKLDESLNNVSYFYNREVNEAIEKLQEMIGPTMTIIMATILGWVMLSVLGPIYDLISGLQT